MRCETTPFFLLCARPPNDGDEGTVVHRKPLSAQLLPPSAATKKYNIKTAQLVSERGKLRSSVCTHMDQRSLILAVLGALFVFVIVPSMKHALVLSRDEAYTSPTAHPSLTAHVVSATTSSAHAEEPTLDFLPPPIATAAEAAGGSLADDRVAPVVVHHQQPLVAANRTYGVGCNAANRRAWRPGKCADDNAWLVPWMHAKPQHDWIVVDVGANKGYVIAGWLETLLGRERTPFTPHNLGVSIYSHNDIKEGFINMCGGCTECVDPPAHVPEDKRARSVKVYGFEPSIANFKWLKFFFNDSSVVEMTNAAVSHSPGTAYFPDGVLGKETGKVSDKPGEGLVPVKIVSLDAFLGEKKSITFIDILSTDAEGFDQDVAKGAESWLRSGRVGVYQFEMYRAEDYKTIFERLYEWGYVCYYFTEVRKGHVAPWLVRISGCWQDYFQQLIGWVNGLCYNSRVAELEPIFERLSKKMHRNGGPSRIVARKRVLQFVSRFVPPKNQSTAHV